MKRLVSILLLLMLILTACSSPTTNTGTPNAIPVTRLLIVMKEVK